MKKSKNTFKDGESCSIIIPTKDNPEYLKLALESVLKQSYPLELIEIIVVDNSSRKSAEQLVQSYSNMINIKYKHVLTAKRNLSKLRNEGVKLAANDYLIFIDSDILLCRDFVKVHMAVLSSAERIASLGYVAGYNKNNDDVYTLDYIKKNKDAVLKFLPESEREKKFQNVKVNILF